MRRTPASSRSRDMPKQSSSRPPAAKRGPRTPYGLTCANCRLRKVKCDGTQPQCRICLAYGEDCRFDKPPPMSQILAMARRISELEHALAESQLNPGSRDGSVVGDHVSAVSPPTHITSSNQSWMISRHASDKSEKPTYQSTSAREGPTRPDEDIPPSLPAETPSMDAPQLAFWEMAATELSAVHLQVPRETVTHLLTTNWTWFHPGFMFVPRALFLRDAAVGGRHFSPLLLAALCLHSTRLTSHALSGNLLAQVRLLLGPELHREWSTTTVQALLLLSAREVGRDAMSQTWLYSGMAFRMAVDLGIFSRRTATLADPEMTAVTEQLAWTCYLWDKTISLYLGRAPALPEPPSFEPPGIDDLLEHEIWSPYYGGNSSMPQASPHVFAHTSSCFANFCRLALIITDILMTIYAKKLPTDAWPFLQQTRRRLEVWRSNSPDHLKVEAGDTCCPPPHVLAQNLLYHATIILLHRPFRGSPHCRTICREASRSITQLIVLLEETWGLTHMSYLVAYCVYTAATVTVLDLHDGVEGSQQRIETHLRALERARTSCPGIQVSIALIRKGIDSKMPPAPPPEQSLHLMPPCPSAAAAANIAAAAQLPTPDPGPLPAFPLDPSLDYAQIGVMPVDMLPFGGLDPYALDWSSLSNDSFGDMLSNP